MLTALTAYPFQYVSCLLCEFFVRETTVVAMDTATNSMKKPTWKRPCLVVKETINTSKDWFLLNDLSHIFITQHYVNRHITDTDYARVFSYRQA